MKASLKLQPEDGFMRAETCSCCVLLIDYILCNKIYVFYFIYYWKHNRGATPEKNVPGF
jgi:hypothetical protein